MSARVRDTAIVRGLEHIRLADLTDHLRELRFWLIQALIVGIAVGHGILEVLEQSEDLGAFAEGILHLPAPTNMVPVVLAALWYGVEGAVLTGVTASIIGLPNLFLFHSQHWEWFGEVMAYTGVLVVAVIVAVMAEREARTRERNEAARRRLDTIRDVTQVLSDHDEAHRLVLAVLSSLTGDGGFAATGFTPNAGVMERPIVVGATPYRPRIAAALSCAEEAVVAGDVICMPVGAGDTVFGVLAAIPPPDRFEPDDEAMVALVAQELGAAIHTILLRSRERENLRHYARAITMAQETERQRVARDLHDETAQSMVLLIRGLGRLEEAGPSSTEISDLQELAQRTLTAIRATILELRPPLLDDLGLHAALEALLERRARRDSCEWEIGVIGEARRVDPDVELALYRTAQEAINNVIRHANATTARIEIRFEPSAVELEVTDNGSGFDPLAPGAIGLGVTGMHERARIVDGDLTIDTTGAGTSVRLRVPYGATLSSA